MNAIDINSFIVSHRNFFQHLFLAFLFCTGALIFFPSELYSQDMVIHIPYIKVIQDPALYAEDYLVNTWQTQKNSFYYIFLAKITSILPFPFDFELRSIHAIILFFTIIFLLEIIEHFKFSLITKLFFLSLLFFRFHVGGTATQLLEAEAIPRAFATCFSLLCASFILKRKFFISLICIGLALIFHPSAPFSLIVIVGIYLAINNLTIKPFTQWSLLLFMILITGSIAVWLSMTNHTMDVWWLSVMKERNRFAFIDKWSLKSWFALGVLIAPACLFLFVKKIRQSISIQIFQSQKVFWKIIIAAFFAGLVLTWAHFLFAVIAPIHGVVLAQIMRIWWWVGMLSWLCLAALLTKVTEAFNATRKLFLVLGIVFFAVSYQGWQKNAFAVDHEWLDIQKWARENTEKSCSFLTPFTSKGFRAGAERTEVAEYKDGTLSAYTISFTKEWSQKKKDLSDWENKNNEDILNLQKKYKFDYIIQSKSKVSRIFSEVFSNKNYSIYQITPCKTQ